MAERRVWNEEEEREAPRRPRVPNGRSDTARSEQQRGAADERTALVHDSARTGRLGSVSAQHGLEGPNVQGIGSGLGLSSSGPYINPNVSVIGRGNYNAGLPSQLLSNLQGQMGSARLPSSIAMPSAGFHINQAAALGSSVPSYLDSAALLRSEIATNRLTYDAAAEYLDLISRRQQAATVMAAAQQQFIQEQQQQLLQEQQQQLLQEQQQQTLRHQLMQRPVVDPLWEAHRLSSLSRLLGQQDHLRGAAALESDHSMFRPTAGLVNDPLRNYPLTNDPAAAFLQLSSQRAEATRFLGGFPTYPGETSVRSFPLPEGKEDPSLCVKLPAKQDDEDPYVLDLPWDDLVADSTLTSPDFRGVVADVDFAVIAQMKPCVLEHEDRVGLYKTRDIGFPGICCKHCLGVPGFGRYFPGSLTSLINGNICKSIIKHLRNECRKCPTAVRNSILKLERQDELAPFHYRRGSRRRFFSYVWMQFHEADQGRAPADGADSATSGGGDEGVAKLPSDDSDETIPWSKLLENSEVVNMSDRHLVPDTIFAATAQTRPCQVTEADRVGRCKDHKLGWMGLCCKHCGGKAGAYGRYFPSNLQTFAQVEVSKQIVKHLTSKCQACPPEIRNAILDLQERETTKPPKRYPSRMVFFRRVWYRFHDGDNPEGESGSDDGKPAATITAVDIPWDSLVEDSKLVTINDRGLISDSQFAAIAQLERCKLTEEDKIGYNKNREIGFVGMCCRFCGGRPNFGRYFPNTVRNFEKTSARDTIVSHISVFCQECPEDIRNALLSIKRMESSREGSKTMKGLIYGSGKLFFRRVWSRLHSVGSRGEDIDTKPAARLASGAEKDAKAKGDSPSLSRTCKGDSDLSTEGNDSSDDSKSEESQLQGKRKSYAPHSSEAKKRQKTSKSTEGSPDASKGKTSKSKTTSKGTAASKDTAKLLPTANSMVHLEPFLESFNMQTTLNNMSCKNRPFQPTNAYPSAVIPIKGLDSLKAAAFAAASADAALRMRPEDLSATELLLIEGLRKSSSL